MAELTSNKGVSPVARALGWRVVLRRDQSAPADDQGKGGSSRKEEKAKPPAPPPKEDNPQTEPDTSGKKGRKIDIHA